MLLLIEALNLEFISRAVALTSLAFCSKVFAALEFKSNKCFELSFACCNVDFHESKLENIILFVVLNADTALSATVTLQICYRHWQLLQEIYIYY